MGRFSSNLEDGSVKTHLHTSPIVVMLSAIKMADSRDLNIRAYRTKHRLFAKIIIISLSQVSKIRSHSFIK